MEKTTGNLHGAGPEARARFAFSRKFFRQDSVGQGPEVLQP